MGSGIEVGIWISTQLTKRKGAAGVTDVGSGAAVRKGQPPPQGSPGAGGHTAAVLRLKCASGTSRGSINKVVGAAASWAQKAGRHLPAPGALLLRRDPGDPAPRAVGLTHRPEKGSVGSGSSEGEVARRPRWTLRLEALLTATHLHVPFSSRIISLKSSCCLFHFLFTRGSPLLLSSSLATVHRLLNAVASLAAEDRPWGTRASGVAGPGCSITGSAAAVLGQTGLEPMSPAKVDALPLSRLGSPKVPFITLVLPDDFSQASLTKRFPGNICKCVPSRGLMSVKPRMVPGSWARWLDWSPLILLQDYESIDIKASF